MGGRASARVGARGFQEQFHAEPDEEADRAAPYFSRLDAAVPWEVKEVGMRDLEHINLELKKTTFALKLKARPSMASRSFRLHTPKLPVENYDIIASGLEMALRNRFNPLIGKQ